MEKLETYQEQKRRHEREWNDFDGIFWAFSNEQFRGGMEKYGLTIEDKGKIFSIGAGGYLLKEKAEEFEALLARHKKERQERNKSQKFLIESIAYELRNHEYNITWDTSEALASLGLEEKNVDKNILKKACKKALDG